MIVVTHPSPNDAPGGLFLWSFRKPGQGVAVVSLSALARLAHMSTETAVVELWRLAEFVLIGIIKRRIRVARIGGGSASRQATNAYVFRGAPETLLDEAVKAAVGALGGRTGAGRRRLRPGLAEGEAHRPGGASNRCRLRLKRPGSRRGSDRPDR